MNHKKSVHFKVSHSIGTALEGLSVMQSFLKSRPKTFSSMEKAIEWRYKKIDHFQNMKKIH
jgi:hypothetical protein